MYRALGFLILLVSFVYSCGGGTIVPTDHPGGDHEPNEFCIDFERANSEGAVNGANALLLYRELGITFPSNPVIINNGALCGGSGAIPGPINNQCLFQGDPGSARPERSCGPLEILIDPGLEAGKVEFEARNVGFISIPVEIVATAYDDSGAVDEFGELIPVDQVRIVSRSELGDLRPVEFITLESDPSELPITSVVVDYTTCPPHVVIDNLCIEPKERQRSRTVGQSDAGADRLVYYFDNRNRKSYIQLANLSNSEIEVHVQIWLANSTLQDCEEIDFIDMYTPNDLHTYDTLNLSSNSGEVPLDGVSAQLAGKYGFVVISKSDGPSDSLVGTMRIIDDAGYEYKTNAVAPESKSTNSDMFGDINFNNISSASELIGFTYSELPGVAPVAAHGVSTTFGDPSGREIFIIGDFIDEDMGGSGTSTILTCSPLTFACNDTFTNIGIDRSLPNMINPSGRVACNTSVIGADHQAGWLYLPYRSTSCTVDSAVGDGEGNCIYDTHFVGFIGLTNGSSSGFFDSWWGGEIIDVEE